MQETLNLSPLCAALLDAWGRNNTSQMGEIAAELRMMSTLCAGNAGDSERLELLEGIALELQRSAALEKTADADPYVRLLLHLAHPNGIENSFAHGSN
jgi:hypothetical protein